MSTTELQFPVAIKAESVDAQRAVIESDVSEGTLALIAGREVSVIISGQADLDAASEELRKVKSLMKAIDDKRKEITRPYDEKKKATMDEVRPYMDGLTKAETLLKNAIGGYHAMLEEQQRIAEAKAEEERRKAAEKLEAKADKLEAAGKVEQADALRENAVTMVASVMPPAFEPQKTAGVSVRKTYSATVTDSAQLIHAAVAQQLLAKCKYDGNALVQYLGELAAKGVPSTVAIVDEKLVNKMASTLKDALDWPGVKVTVSNSVAARTR